MVLASFPVINRRWKPAHLVHKDYESYPGLTVHIQKEVYDTRIAALQRVVRKEYPHIWVDTYLFSVAVLLVITAAVFAIIARAFNLALWYPLLILIVPALIAYWTTRRRGLQFFKTNCFHEALQACLRECDILDMHHHLHWSYRHPTDNEDPDLLHLEPPLSSYKIMLVIDVDETLCQSDSSIPSPTDPCPPPYDAATRDVVLDVGPAMQEISHSSRTVVLPPPIYSPHSS